MRALNSIHEEQCKNNKITSGSNQIEEEIKENKPVENKLDIIEWGVDCRDKEILDIKMNTGNQKSDQVFMKGIYSDISVDKGRKSQSLKNVVKKNERKDESDEVVGKKARNKKYENWKKSAYMGGEQEQKDESDIEVDKKAPEKKIDGLSGSGKKMKCVDLDKSYVEDEWEIDVKKRELYK